LRSASIIIIPSSVSAQPISTGLLRQNPAEALRAENLFLRRQLALYIERGGRPQRVDAATRISLALLKGSSIGAARWWSCSRRR
jgi:hypothetical protein